MIISLLYKQALHGMALMSFDHEQLIPRTAWAVFRQGAWISWVLGSECRCLHVARAFEG
jgi:hypothetical protein